MKKVVPMRAPSSSPLKYNNNLGFIREFEFPFGVLLSVLAWMVLALYFGVIILGVFGVVSLTGIGVGAIRHSMQPSPVLSCVPASESRIPEIHETIRKAA